MRPRMHFSAVPRPRSAESDTLSPLRFACVRSRYMILPDMLKNAPMFKKMDPKVRVRQTRPLWPP